MDWDKLLIKERFKSSGGNFDELGRSGFQRDIDRIVFSPAFRRLQGKTQVHPLPQNDHIHNRLTHSLEVASVGRTLGNCVGLILKDRGKLPASHSPEDIGEITQAACITHDIGNPPFGHACEASIGQWLRKWLERQKSEHKEKFGGFLTPEEHNDLIFFDGNAQGFRTLTRLEYHFHDGGMRLSYPTLAAYLKYPWTPASAPNGKRGKASCFLSEKQFLNTICAKVGLVQISPDQWCRHPLAHLVEAADDICYKVIDVEDGIELGILDFKDYEKLLRAIDSSITLEKSLPPGQARKMFSALRGGIFDQLIKAATQSFFDSYDTIMTGEFQGDLISSCNDKVADLLGKASSLCHDRVFTDRKKTIIEIGVFENINITLGTFCEAVFDFVLHKDDRDMMSPLSQKVVKHVEAEGFSMPNTLYECLRGVIDYVAGMTDNYATYVARHIGGIVD